MYSIKLIRPIRETLSRNQSKCYPTTLFQFTGKFINFHGNWQKNFSIKSSKNTIRNKKNLTRSKLFASGLATGICLSIAVLFWKNQEQDASRSSYWPTDATIAAKTTKNPIGNRVKYNFIADVVAVSAPAVVYIEVKDTRRYDLFTRQPMTASNGSGFIVHPDGLILTNAHVVINKPHTSVMVRLLDGRQFPGVVEDVDQASDLATVRIRCNNLSAMKLGSSADLSAGEWVVALGSPLALNNTVTVGVVSSTHRASQELGLRGKNINYIQTDAAITFGNSGGPLVNLDGEAIGINSMKVTPGISFAIPIDYAKVFLNRGMERRVKGVKESSIVPIRRYMGITMLTLTDEILDELRHRSQSVPDEVRSGVLVWKVIIGSPAHHGGLNPGDIITNINGKDMHSSSDIYEVLGKKGEVLNMVIYRGKDKIQVRVIPEDPE